MDTHLSNKVEGLEFVSLTEITPTQLLGHYSRSRVVVERYDRLELRTKDSNVTVVGLSLFNYGGGPGQCRPGPCIARKVQEESGPE